METEQYFAAIDLGTNSCRLVIADTKGEYLCKKNVKTALGEGMYKEMKITPEAFQRGVNCLNDFSKEIKHYSPCRLRAVATAGCRMAKNAAEFLAKVKEKSHIDLEVIDAHEEARLNLKGASVHVMGQKPYVLLYDLGGGSTEITLAENNDAQRILYTISIPWGARNASEAFALNNYDAKQADKLRAEVKKYVTDFMTQADWAQYKDQCSAVATSSSPLRLAAMIEKPGEYKREAMDGKRLITSEVDKVIAEIFTTTEAERAASPYIGAKRAPIFVAACVIFQQIYQDLGLTELTASLKSAKDGIIEELRREYGKTNTVGQKSQRPQRVDRSCQDR